MSDPSERLAKPFQKRHLQKVQFLPIGEEIGKPVTAKVSRQNGMKSEHPSLNPKLSGDTSDDTKTETHNTDPLMVLCDIPTQKIQSLPVVPSEISAATSNATNARFDSHEAILLGLAVLLLSFASLFLIGSKSFWLDEAYSIQLVHSWPTMWSQLFIYDHNAWLYYILLYGWARLGNSEAYVRGLSALFAIASLPVYYLLSKKLFGKKVAFIAVFILAVNGFYIQYAQQARSYSLFFFLCLLSTLLFIHLLHKQSKLLYVLYIFCVILSRLYSG
ncbi:MAG: glycosyltransferase family 39 protein [Ktedonobacteraceae bacterium]